MKTSERLRRKIKREFPQIKHIDEMVFRRVNGISDGVKFTWTAELEGQRYPDASMIYSYDTMTDCLKKPLGVIYDNGAGNGTEGWHIGVV